MLKSALLETIRIRSLDLVNRIVVAPMCQYWAEDGCMNEWHLIHLGQLTFSGAALLTIEAGAVTEAGRITDADVSLNNDKTESANKRILKGVCRWSTRPIGIQLSHAGRKASTEVPWKSGDQLSPPTLWDGSLSVHPAFRSGQKTARRRPWIEEARERFGKRSPRPRCRPPALGWTSSNCTSP
jgi:2,4-dienoyl-CoA reductase-like NADH-dependent reductase (Old Yellow Enzyme family)